MTNYKDDPRWPVQRAVIDEIEEYFKNGEKYVVVRGPTGFGKSLTGLMLAKEVGPTYITSTQVVLVDQYQKMLYDGFVGLGKAIKGLSNYKCKMGALNAAEGPCHLPGYKCPVRNECDYYIARDEAINSNTAVMTFHYFMYPVRYALTKGKNFEFSEENNHKKYNWPARKLLIIDEAHDLPEVLRDFFSLSVREKTFGREIFNVLKRKQLDSSENLLITLKQELIHLKPAVEDVLDDMTKRASSLTPTDVLVKYQGHTYSVSEFLEMTNQQSSSLRRIEHYLDSISRNSDWVFSREQEAFVWKPYESGVYMQQLFEKFEHVVFMSATFINHKLFMDRLGIQKYKFIDIPSRFDPNNGKVYLYYDNWLRKNSSDAVKGRIVARIESIAKTYSRYKGIIHCHTYEWQKYIYDMASPELRHRLVVHDSGNRSQVLREFYVEKNPKILLSVNMDKGLDLKDDMARWQVIVKAPFPYLGDAWVQLHREKMPEWYDDNTLVSIVQACGRIVRTDTDWGHTYILDGNASNLLDSNIEKLPTWFVKRIQHLK